MTSVLKAKRKKEKKLQFDQFLQGLNILWELKATCGKQFSHPVYPGAAHPSLCSVGVV